jgi:hypothetical protein
MKRAQVAALVAGAALGLVGVTAAIVLSRKETREAALNLARTSAELGAKGSKVAGELAVQARKISAEVARQAAEQYQAQAPRAVETLSGVLPLLGVGKKEPEPVTAQA